MLKGLTVLILTLIVFKQGTAQAIYKSSYDSIRFFVEKDEYGKALTVCNRIIEADSNQMNAWYYRGYCAGELKQFEEAAKCYSKIAWFKPEKTTYWTSAGWYALLSGQYDSAVLFCQQALSLQPEDFNSFLNLAHAYYLKNDLKKAEYYYLIASEYLPLQQEMLNRVIKDLDLMDSLKSSAFIRTVRLLFPDDYTLVKNNTASNPILDTIYLVATGDGENKSAELDRLKTSFILAQEKEETKRLHVLRDFYYNLGRKKLFAGDNKSAIYDYIRPGKMADEYLRDSISLFTIHMQLSEDVSGIMRGRNKFNPRMNDAIFFAEEALRYAETYKLPGKAELAFLQLGDCYRYAGAHNKSLSWYLRALPLIPQKNIYGLYENTLNNIVNCYVDKNDFDSAAYYYSLFQQRSNRVQDPYGKFLSGAANFQTVLYRNGQYKTSAGNCLALIREAKKKQHFNDDISHLLETAGLSYYQLGKPDSAMLLLRESVESYKKYAGENHRRTPGDKILFVQEEKKGAYACLKKIMAEKNATDDLFQLMEETKESLLYYLLTSQVYPEKPATLRECREKIPANSAGLSFSDFFNKQGGMGIAFNRDGQLFFKHDNKLLAKEMEGMKQQYRSILDLMNLSETTLKDKEKAAMFFPLGLYLQTSGFKTASRGIIASNRGADSSALSDGARIAVSKILYRFYIKPYEALLKGKEVLYISTDLFLSYIPFEVLMDETGVYLGEKYKIIYVPSFTVKHILESKTYADTRNILVFGNPDYKKYHPENLDGRAWEYAVNAEIKLWNELPGTEKELGIIQQIMPGCRVYQQSSLSESGIKQLSKEGQLNQAGILHFALHGFTNMNAGLEDNSLIVSEPDTGGEDGFLRFWETFSLDMRPRVIILSACESAFGVPKEDGSAASMTTAFLAAGAGACIGTNWKIADEPTTLFIGEFYRQVAQKVDFAEALFRVRKKFISGEMGKQYQSPYYWAPFKYYGF